MRCVRGGRAAVLSLTLTTVLLVGETTAGAAPAPPDGDAGGQDGQDVAVPAADAAAQLAEGDVLTAAGALAVPPLDDFRYDAQLTEGYARDVCYGRLRPGTARTFTELTRRFGGSAGTLYACRERWNAAEEPDCNGTLVDPRNNGSFYSTCWSNHAAGRALDIMVGRSGGGYNVARGNAIVNWLLEPDSDGNYSSRARRLGVMQILWRDHCWNTDDDRGVVQVKRMRACGIGHFDHVHIDLTIAGAEGRTSYWGGRPVIEPKFNGLLWWDQQSGRRGTHSWFNFRARYRSSPPWNARWDVAVNGDFRSDGRSSDLFVWDRDTGDWVVSRWRRGRWRTAATGRLPTWWDRVVPGDWDGDGRRDDILLWDVHSGRWQVRMFTRTAHSKGRGTGSFALGYDDIAVGDFDEDNRHDDTFIFDRDSGRWQVLSWTSFRPDVRTSGAWAARFNQFVIGDWDSDGELNDMLLRDPASGEWMVASWNRFWYRWRTSGMWSPRYTKIVAADLDAEGRVDDMVVYSPRTGGWNVIEWRYYKWRTRYRAVGSARWDQVIAGQWA
jgi:hypothetical protein